MARLRRSSRLLSSPIKYEFEINTRQKRRAPDQEPASEDSGIGMQTPKKSHKRVRFSDIGPEIATSGLTPFVRRATLSPGASLGCSTPSQRGRRRRSAPADLPTPPSTPSSECRVIQFTPLRQEIDSRQRRRLRRSHLSETQNEVDSEHRTSRREYHHEIERLQSEIRDLTWELETQRQFGVQVSNEEEQRAQGMKDELRRLKHEQLGDEIGIQPISPALSEGDTILDSAMHNSTYDLRWQDSDLPSSPLGSHLTAPDTPPSLSHLDFSGPPITTDTACQASLPHPQHEEQVVALEQTITDLTRESTDAQTAFNTLQTLLHNLGFAPTSPSEDTAITVRDTIRTTRLRLEKLLPGETTCGTQDGKRLLEELIRHIERLLTCKKDDAKQIQRQQQSESALRTQFHAALAQKQEFNERLDIVEVHRRQLVTGILKMEEDLDFHKETAREKERQHGEAAKAAHVEITTLQKAAEDQTTTIERLQSALNKYREEVGNLEGIIGELERGSGEKEMVVRELRERLRGAEGKVAEKSEEVERLGRGVDEAAFGLTRLVRVGLGNVTRRGEKVKWTRDSDEDAEVPGGEDGVREDKGDKRDSGVGVA